MSIKEKKEGNEFVMVIKTLKQLALKNNIQVSTFKL